MQHSVPRMTESYRNLLRHASGGLHTGGRVRRGESRRDQLKITFCQFLG